MRAVPTSSTVENPLRPERFFRAGTVARFYPPPGAYSRQSEQHRQRGYPCLIVRCWNDSHATVTFGQGAPLVVNLDYLETEEAVPYRTFPYRTTRQKTTYTNGGMEQIVNSSYWDEVDLPL